MHWIVSLNPCCSGRWSRTFFNRKEFSNLSILILVVVEDGLVQYYPNYEWTCSHKS